MRAGSGDRASLRVATYNLLHGISLTDARVDADRLRSAAASLDADVVGLQEVDSFQPRSGSIDQTAEVAGALGAEHWRFVAALQGVADSTFSWTAAGDEDEPGDQPRYGIGLVSRLPVLRWETLRFPAAPLSMPLLVPGSRRPVRIPDEPRVAVAAVVAGPRGPLTVITAHLSFVPGWNARQLRNIAGWARDLPAPRLLLGDFNLPGAIPRLVTGWRQLARVATYPAFAPRIQFDHVLADGIDTDQVVAVSSRPLPVSDHRALVVDLDLTDRVVAHSKNPDITGTDRPASSRGR